jgi:non-specific serine/threonine protein kinase/protein-serine/threonine kinase
MQQRPRPGLQIDGFTLGAELHRGGFATIWDVTHPGHAGPMVMKVPTILDGDDGPTIVGFETEQMILPRLTGPHVPKVIAVGDFSVMPYIVTERIDGGSLLARHPVLPLALSDLVETGARIAAALDDLHRQEVIHLDLKPANLLQRPGGEIVLIDFGLSRHDALPDLLAEEFRVPMGTFPYLAPEQYLRQRGDLRSDLFALGAILYELATGRKPFGDPASLRGVRRRLWRDPLPPRALVPDLPEWLQEIILRALEVDPARRTQSAAQVLFDLAQPAQVRLTERGHRTAADGAVTVWRRWWRMRRLRAFAAPPVTATQLSRAPILLVAVDLAPETEDLARRLRDAVRRMLVIEPDARVACVNVLKTPRLGLEQGTDEAGNNLHVLRLVALRDWAEGLDLPEERLTFSVLENPDPAAAILDFARNGRVGHILMGARASSAGRRFLGSVSARVVAEAECSVTVIRLDRREAEPAAEAAPPLAGGPAVG